MTFAVSGGIEWEKDETNKVLTVRPTATPEEGYESGQMKDYENPGDAPWGQITTTGWTLKLANGITRIGIHAFYYCSGFTGSLTIPDSVISIGGLAFAHCFGFTGSLMIGSGVQEIENHAFSNCWSFTGSLIIGRAVTTIWMRAFDYCPKFSKVIFLGDKPEFNDTAFCLNWGDPVRTYDVYSNGWANSTTFPPVDWYTKWNYKSLELLKAISVKVGDTWKQGTPYVKVNGVWKQGTPYVNVDGVWK